MIEALSDNIQALIEIRGIQVGKLEKQLGVSAGYFSRVRRGMSISSEVLYKLSKAVDVSMDDLCSKGYKNRLIKEDRPQFVSSPTEVIKVGEPVSNSDEINKALEKGELYKRGFEDAMRRFKRPQDKWIPIITRELTEEEKEEYPDWIFIYDCPLPEDGEEVLVTTLYGDTALDTFCRDDGCYFENYCDEEDVIAWMPKPEPYKKGGKENEDS